MKILLINCPIRLDAQPNCIPYGLATIASVLRNNGYEVEIYDINALRPLEHEIVDTLSKKTWDIVGLSGLVTTYKFQKWLMPILKKIHRSSPIISGGGLATSSSELLFDHSELDIAVVGEGEQTIIDLCQAIEAGDNLGSIPGVSFRQNDRIFRNETRKNIHDLDTIPFPAWDLLAMEIYLKNPIWGNVANNSSGFKKNVKVTRSMNIISSRGCPFSCNYCYHLFGRSDYRFRSVGNVVAEIEQLVDRYGVDFVGLVDDNMMISELRLLEFCDLMESKNFPVTWGCHGRVTSARPEILERMAEVGCVWIGYGIESGSQKILNAMNKKAKIEQARKAIMRTRNAGIYPNTTFIFGYPGETIDTVQKTISFKREMGLECGSFFATPYPGTPLYSRVQHLIKDEEGFILSLGNATEFTINLTEFNDQAMFRMKKAMDENRDVIS
jgi:anaerobic magnesium-protoporphyrin IX monomethyl ester cyclase